MTGSFSRPGRLIKELEACIANRRIARPSGTWSHADEGFKSSSLHISRGAVFLSPDFFMPLPSWFKESVNA
jgi:hypothetical protein